MIVQKLLCHRQFHTWGLFQKEVACIMLLKCVSGGGRKAQMDILFALYLAPGLILGILENIAEIY